MEKKTQKYELIFNKFKKNNTPFPIIQLKINQHSKDIEKILCEMDKNYSMKKPINKKQSKSENKTRNKKSILTEEKAKEKITFGPVTYLTYKENIEDDINLRRFIYEDLRHKVSNSKNFKVGLDNKNYNNKNIKKIHLSKFNNKISLSEKRSNKKGKTRINISPFFNNNQKINDKNEDRKITNNIIDKEKNVENEISNNDNYNILETRTNTNRDFNNIKSTFKGLSSIFPFNENKGNTDSNIANDNNLIIDTYVNTTRRNSNLSSKNNSIINKANIINYSSRNYKRNKEKNNNYSITNYLEKERPIGLKETAVNNKSKTSSNFNDYKDLFKYYRTNNNFLSISNTNNINSKSKNNNNTQLNPFSMLNMQFNKITDIAQSQEKKLNYLAKKKINLKFIEKMIKRNEVSNSIIGALSNGKRKKVKLKANFHKIKKQIEHLSTVDKVEKYSDSIPSEKLKTFNHHYNKKCEKIGISDNCITFNNGKIYRQSKSDSKNLSFKIRKNCDEITKLAEQILIERFYFEEKDSKYKRVKEIIQNEKIDLSSNKSKYF